MSIERPKGSYTGPLSLQWCNYSMTVRAMPMNYLAADLSRIDAALWGRESEIGAAIAEAPAMVEALRDNLNQFEQMESMFRDDVEFIAALKATRAILSRIDGAGPPLSAYAETVTDAEYREIANGRASWPLKGASGDGAGDTLPDAPVPAPTGEAKPARYLNSYTCDRCNHEWQDEWSCAADDDCPSCGARHMSPHASYDLGG